MRRITVRLPKDLLEHARAQTGEGVTETVRAALKHLASLHAQEQLKGAKRSRE
jgi:Arc/MetJ-type ribon-helix-helix transcriptional regulator